MNLINLQLKLLNFFRTVISSDYDKHESFFYLTDENFDLIYSLYEDYDYIKPYAFVKNKKDLKFFSRKNRSNLFERFFPIYEISNKNIACFFVLVGSFDFIEINTPKVRLFLKNVTYDDKFSKLSVDSKKSKFVQSSLNINNNTNSDNKPNKELVNNKTKTNNNNNNNNNNNLHNNKQKQKINQKSVNKSKSNDFLKFNKVYKEISDCINVLNCEEKGNILFLVKKVNNSVFSEEEISRLREYFSYCEYSIGSTSKMVAFYLSTSVSVYYDSLKTKFSNYIFYISFVYSDIEQDRVKKLMRSLSRIKNPIMEGNLVYYKDNVLPCFVIHCYYMFPELFHDNLVNMKNLFNSSDISSFIDCYFENGLSKTLTGEKMKIHRNTVLNRINKISSIFKIDLNTFEGKVILYFIYTIFVNLKDKIAI